MSDPRTSTAALDRRGFVTLLSRLGVGAAGGGALASSGAGAALFPGALWTRLAGDRSHEGPDASPQVDPSAITPATIREAEKIAGIEFTEEERELMVENLREQLEDYRELEEVHVPNHVPPAVDFDPVLPGVELPRGPGVFRPTPVTVGEPPADPERLAFEPVTRLSAWLRSGAVSSETLTRTYLERLERYDPELRCVVTLTRELALEQARRADRELREGRWRGPLHGVPWGAKDLLAVRGYPTTWGAAPFRHQVMDTDATVYRRLTDAGAVLVAKLSMGALARGDVWFGGETRNPWNPEEGSSGSSAGPAAATAAGLVGFGIGTETLGSIVSPANRCGVTGLRPTFGRVSRHGAMTLSWSQDKIGPMCRSVEDCALVLRAVTGPDGLDRTVRDVPFSWEPAAGLEGLRIGYYRSAFEEAIEEEEEGDGAAFHRRALEVFRGLGVDPVPVELPDDRFPVRAVGVQARAEEAAAFDEFTRSGTDDLLTRQDEGAWPNAFRSGQMIPAVQYLRANRVRYMLMGAMREVMADVDVFVTPTYGGSVLRTTNLTGHPSVTVPNGFREDGTPVSISFIGRLFGEGALLRVARVYQEETGFHREHPPRFLPG